MLIKENKMPDLSNLQPSVTGCYLASSLVGFKEGVSVELHKTFPVMARLVDKAIYEYILTYELATEEEKEGKMSYEKLMKRNKGQFFYATSITNHLENCINAICRVYKVIDFVIKKEKVLVAGREDTDKMRNTIEHIHGRILRSIKGSTSLNISEDGLSFEIAGETLMMKDLANQIRFLYKEATTILSLNCIC